MAENAPPDAQDVVLSVAAAQASAEGGGTPFSQNIEETGVISHLEVDVDNDSTFGSDSASTSTSISSSAMEFRYEHGRRYHAYRDGKYHLPNDKQEMDRLELQHLLWCTAFNNRLYLAPLPDNMTHVIDVGCGTGAWAIEFADAHPNTHILGTDLSPIQPETIPVNCKFLIDDATQEWAFATDFDFVHTRAITMGIPDWTRVIDQAYRSLKPGGWIELQEFHLPLECDDGSMTEESPLYKWGKEMQKATKQVGINSLASLEHPTIFRNRGFINVQQTQLKVPLGPWAKGKKEKQLGLIAQKDLIEGVEGISTKLLLMLGYTQEDLTTLLNGVKDNVKNPQVHSYMSLDIAWGQKPLET